MTISDSISDSSVSLTPTERFRIRVTLSFRRFKEGWRLFAQDTMAVLGVIIIIIFGILAIIQPILIESNVWPSGVFNPVTGYDMEIFIHPSPPGGRHIFGTDVLGRDVLSILLWATTPTFVIGSVAAITTAVVGIALAIPAAYFRGTVDIVLSNIMDIFLLLPAPLLMIIIGGRFRDLGPVQLGLIYGVIAGGGTTAIVLRSHALKIASQPYMEAARIAGGGPSHIIFKHFLPNIAPLAALHMMISVTGVIVADGFISFFGFTRVAGNWGAMIYDAFVYTNILGSGTQWHVLLPPALAFSLFAGGFYMISRGLQKVMDPKLRGELRA